MKRSVEKWDLFFIWSSISLVGILILTSMSRSSSYLIGGYTEHKDIDTDANKDFGKLFGHIWTNNNKAVSNYFYDNCFKNFASPDKGLDNNMTIFLPIVSLIVWISLLTSYFFIGFNTFNTQGSVARTQLILVLALCSIGYLFYSLSHIFNAFFGIFKIDNNGSKNTWRYALTFFGAINVVLGFFLLSHAYGGGMIVSTLLQGIGILDMS